VAIDNTKPWRKKHWESIRQSYARAEHAAAYLPLLEGLYVREWNRLADLDIEITRTLAGALGIETPWRFSSEWALGESKTRRLVEICRALGATHYLSGPTARAYLEEGQFRDAGIVLEYMEYDYPPYPQGRGAFDPAVSVIDLLLHCGPEAGDWIWGRRARAFREECRA
jgi:hypothetical protein